MGFYGNMVERISSVEGEDTNLALAAFRIIALTAIRFHLLSITISNFLAIMLRDEVLFKHKVLVRVVSGNTHAGHEQQRTIRVNEVLFILDNSFIVPIFAGCNERNAV